MRKGVSPIIAVLLLILIAISAGVMVYVFISGWIGSATTVNPNLINLINVDYAYADADNDILTLAIRNLGSTQVTIDKIYIKSPTSTTAYPDDMGILQRIISIQETSGTDLVDYQVKIILNASNFDFTKANSDGSDIRFYDMDGRELPYYIEYWDSTAQLAIIWVKVDLPAASTTNIKMVYHNSYLTTSTSNPYKVFDFFDGFDGSTLNTSVWAKSAGATISVGGGEIFIDSGAIYTPTPIFPSPKGLAFEAKVTYTTSDGDYSGLEIANEEGTKGGNQGENALLYIMTDPQSTDIYAWGADGIETGYDFRKNVYTISLSSPYIIGFKYYPGGGVDYYVTDLQHNLLGSQYWSGGWSSSVPNDVYMFLGYFMGANSGNTDINDMYVDWVRIRKVASSEPAVSIGAEEPYTLDSSIKPGDAIIININYAIDPGTRYEISIVTRDGGKVVVSTVGK